MFERDGKKLAKCIVDLASGSAQMQLEASDRIVLMALGLPTMNSAVGAMNEREREGFAGAVRAAFDTPDFPCEDTLRGLIGHVQAMTPENPIGVCRRIMGRKRNPKTELCMAASCILRHVGPAGQIVLPELTEMIEDCPTSGEADLAARTIESIGPAAAEAAPALMDGLREVGDDFELDSDEGTEWNPFVDALASIAKGDNSVLSALISMAKHEEDEARDGAIVTLGEIGPHAKAAIPLLLELTAETEYAHNALRALRAINPDGDGNTRDVLMSRLTTCDEDDRRDFVRLLREYGVSESDIAAEISKAPVEQRCHLELELFYDEDDDNGENYLDDLYPELAEVDTSTDLSKPLDELVKNLLASDSSVCRTAANTLTVLAMGQSRTDCDDWELNSRLFVEELMKLFANPSFPTAEVLGRIISRFAAAQRDYQKQIGASDSMDWMVNHEALCMGSGRSAVIENCGPGGAVVLEQLAGLLREDTDDHVLSRVAALAMKSIGEPAAVNTDALLDNILSGKLMEWPNPRLEFIENYGLSEAQLTRVTQIVEHGSGPRRVAAIQVLDVLGPRAAAAREALVHAVLKGDDYAKSFAVSALAAVAGDSPEVISILMDRTHDSNDSTRGQAACALGKVSNPSEEIVGRLFELTRDREWYVRGEAIRSLGMLGHREAEVLARATELLTDLDGHDWNVSERAVEAIGALGGLGAPAVPRLIEMLDGDGDDLVVVRALGAIGPEASAALDRLRILRMCEPEDREEIEAAIRSIADQKG